MATSLQITEYPSLANACETRVVPENPSNTVLGFALATRSKMCGSSLSFEPAYLTPSVSGGRTEASAKSARLLILLQCRLCLLDLYVFLQLLQGNFVPFDR